MLRRYHCILAGFFFTTSALSSVLTLRECHGHDLEIANQTPIFHVPDVVINPLRQIGIAAQTVDLRPTGYSRFGIMTSIVECRV
jgi:hypothetical protein